MRRERLSHGSAPELHAIRAMLQVLASVVDSLHALLMAAWVLGLPLLFWHGRPRLTRAYGVYAIVFIVLSQGSRFLLGECFLTTLSRFLWQHGPAARSAPDEWFTVRFAELIFHLTPSHRAISIASEALVLVTAVGMLATMARWTSSGSEVEMPFG